MTIVCIQKRLGEGNAGHPPVILIAWAGHIGGESRIHFPYFPQPSCLALLDTRSITSVAAKHFNYGTKNPKFCILRLSTNATATQHHRFLVRSSYFWRHSSLGIASDCAHFCAHHQTLSSNMEYTVLIASPCQTRHSAHSVTISNAQCKLLILRWLGTQNPPGFGPWGFNSPSRHHDSTGIISISTFDP
jgi:hypothetical protein